MRDYFKYYKTNSKNPVSSQKFNKVISEFNKAIVDAIINDGLEYTPPKLQMTFCIRKYKKLIKIENGKLVNNNPIDWKTTKQLWDDDADAAERKILIKFLNNHTSKYIFRIKVLKTGYFYKNKKFYKFKACRSFQRRLAKRILDPNQDNFQAYDLY
ncbi:MAG TPA: hypothetical protein VF680_16765 [Allosphingosinicella sp.]